jgi:DNA phosphorothioation-associated putative methyltransferase
VVSARLKWERNQIKGTEYGDGILTRRRTFQHLYAAGELRDYVEEATGVRWVSAAPGIVYAFRDDVARLSYLARQVTPDGGWLASEDTASAITSVVAHLEERGRIPQMEEMPQSTIGLLGHLRPAELKRLAEQEADPVKVERSAERGAPTRWCSSRWSCFTAEARPAVCPCRCNWTSVPSSLRTPRRASERIGCCSSCATTPTSVV